jgi:LAGLIDADG DNA endonuclease family
MIINSITVSPKKLEELKSYASENELRLWYTNEKRSDQEISFKTGLSINWVNKLRRIYGINTRPDYLLNLNPLRFVPVTKRQEDFLYGSLLGDSYIAHQKSGTGYWLCRHSTKQDLYLHKQAEIMKPFTAKIYYGSRPFKKGGKSFPYVSARSFALSIFTGLRQELYPEGKKKITSEWIKKLTPTGFAFWFLDDGSTTGCGFDITIFDPYFRTKEFIDVLHETLGLVVHIYRKKDAESTIHIMRESHDKAWEYISPEITKDMLHKIPKRYKN